MNAPAPAPRLIKQLSLYRSANVREYWIVDPMKQTVLVYDMEHDSAPAIYSFSDSVKVNIYDDLWIHFQKMNFFDPFSDRASNEK